MKRMVLKRISKRVGFSLLSLFILITSLIPPIKVRAETTYVSRTVNTSNITGRIGLIGYDDSDYILDKPDDYDEDDGFKGKEEEWDSLTPDQRKAKLVTILTYINSEDPGHVFKDDEIKIYTEDKYIIAKSEKGLSKQYESKLKDLKDISIVKIMQKKKWFPVIDTGDSISAFSNDEFTGSLLFAPNLYMLVWNMLDANIDNSGFNDSEAHKVSRSGFLYKPKKESKDQHTALQRYGFDIASVTYNGEYPVTTIDIKEVVPTGFWSGIASAIKAVFGGSVTKKVKLDVFDTLTYKNAIDYRESNEIKSWYEEYWTQVQSAIPLLYSTPVQNDDGTAGSPEYSLSLIAPFGYEDEEKDKYNAYDILVESGIINLGANEFDKFQQIAGETFGEHYGEILLFLSYFTDKTLIIGRTVRFQPYDTKELSMTSGEYMEVSLVEDPRFQKENLIHYTLFSNNGGNIGLSLTSFNCNLALTLNGLTDFSILEKRGIDISFLYRSMAFKLFIGVLTVLSIMLLLKKGVAYLTGKGVALYSIVVSFVTSIILIFSLTVVSLSPETFKTIFKNIMGLESMMQSGIISSSDNFSDYYSSNATTKEKADLIYWMPYFNSWSLWNTNHTADDPSQVIDMTETTCEVSGGQGDENSNSSNSINVSCINGEQKYNWALLMAACFTKYNGKVSPGAYRVVDHFYAPRLNITYDGDKPIVTTTINENYNGKFHTNTGNYWLSTFSILIAQFIKTFWFFLSIVEFMTLFIYIIDIKDKTEGKAKEVLLGFGFCVFDYFIISIITTFIAVLAYQYGEKLITSFFIFVISIGVIVWFIKMTKNQKYKPNFVKMVKNKFNAI